ncbi:hypothetical protein Hanom_Chr16g01494091 [Helianthus anomalus]
MSVSIGAFTTRHQLIRPEEVSEELDDYIKKSLFMKIEHVQEAGRQEITPDPICGVYTKHMKPYMKSLN